MESLVDACIKDGVEFEKCVVSQHKTTIEQRDIFAAHIKNHPRTKIPIEWVIDIADESSGWFYGTAYDFDDQTQQIHVMVPDKISPTFDGYVQLDFRTVHLIECVDGKSDALFNKIVRDSIIKVRWELEWFEEVALDEHHTSLAHPAQHHDGEAGAKGKWVPSVARYYIRIANQLLVEDDESGADKKGFVMITADINVRLIHCSKGKGQEDFNQMVNEGQVQSTDAAKAEAQLPLSSLSEALAAEDRLKAATGGPRRDKRTEEPAASVDTALILKIHDMAMDLKDCMQELLEERDKTIVERTKMAKAYHAFTTQGDLDAAYTLARQVDDILLLEEKSTQGKYRDEPDPRNAIASEAWHLVTRVEKTLNKVLAAGGQQQKPSKK